MRNMGLFSFLSMGQSEQPKPLPSAACLAFKTLIFLFLDILVGVLIFYLSGYGGTKSSSALVDSFYLSSATVSTTGYGDVVPTSYRSKMLTFAYIIFNASIINYCVAPSFVRVVQFLEGKDISRSRRILCCIVYSVICLVIGILPFRIEKTEWEDVAYAIIVSFTSTGFGDFAFRTVWGRVVGSVWLLLSYLLNYRLGCLVFEAGDDSFAKSEAAEERARRREEAEAEKSARERVVAEKAAQDAREQAENDAREQIAKSTLEQAKAEMAARDAAKPAQDARDERDQAREDAVKCAIEQAKAERAAQDACKEAEKSNREREKAEKEAQEARVERDEARENAIRSACEQLQAEKAAQEARVERDDARNALKAAKDAVRDVLAAEQVATARLESLVSSHTTKLENLARAHSAELGDLRSKLRDAERNDQDPEIG